MSIISHSLTNICNIKSMLMDTMTKAIPWFSLIKSDDDDSLGFVGQI